MGSGRKGREEGCIAVTCALPQVFLCRLFIFYAFNTPYTRRNQITRLQGIYGNASPIKGSSVVFPENKGCCEGFNVPRKLSVVNRCMAATGEDLSDGRQYSSVGNAFCKLLTNSKIVEFLYMARRKKEPTNKQTSCILINLYHEEFRIDK